MYWKRRIKSNSPEYEIKNIPWKAILKFIKKDIPHIPPHLLQNCRDHPIVSIMVATWPPPWVCIRIIKVTPQDWEGGRRSEWSESFFSKVFWIFQKRTFINVLFPKKVFRFEKNIDFVTQSIMLTFTFLSWIFCYDNFFSQNLKIYIGGRGRRFCLQKKVQKMPDIFLCEACDVKCCKKVISFDASPHQSIKSLQKFTKVYKKMPQHIML